MSSALRQAKKPRRRFSSGSQDVAIPSLSGVSEQFRDTGQHNTHAFPSASAFRKTQKSPSPSKAGSPPRERRQTHVYDRAYYTDGSDVDFEADWRWDIARRGRSTSEAIANNNESGYALQERHHAPPTAYASLPATPILPSKPCEESAASVMPLTPLSPMVPPVSMLDSSRSKHTNQASKVQQLPPFSLWDYLREELLATDFDSHQELKWERVSNFLNIPLAMEKIIGFGFIICLDSFLYTFTILPIRFCLAFVRLITNLFRPSAPPLPPSQKADLLRALLLVTSLLILNPLTDASKIYHTIRGQDTIKLYVIFNALEIGDRLCASIGQDILDCLFSRSTLEPLSHRKPVTTHTFTPFLYFFLATVYNVAHALVMVYQLIALNVAINSYDHALLTLLVSNQFVEIKGSVFKRFEKDNLFQITCADIVERFTLALMLSVVAFRNLIELSGSEFDFSSGFALPKSFGWFRGNNVLWTISYPVLTVMCSEMLVDWLKHAFITKFNHIKPSVYERYKDVLCQDLASASAVGRRGGRKHSYVDQSPLVARRLGFASLPLAVLVILVGSQSIALIFGEHETTFFSFWHLLSIYHLSLDTLSLSLRSTELVKYATLSVMAILFWLCFVVVKIILGVNLITYATRRRAGMEEREAADVVNDFGRDPIGEGEEERKYNKGLKKYFDDDQDDAPRLSDMGENKQGQKLGKKERVKLQDLTRYTMVKRIW